MVIPLVGDETPNAKLWTFNLTKTLKEDQFVEVLVTLWALWWAQCKAIHKQEFQSPLSTHLFISRYLDEVRGSQRGQSRSNCPAIIRAPQAWKPPLVGHAKLNADAAVAKNANKGAVGVVCRDEHGNYLGASAVVFEGLTEPETLKVFACPEAQALGEDLALRKIHIATDCLRVMHELKETEQRGEYCIIVKEINSRRSVFLACEICHEQREHNFEAHTIAKMATSLDVGRHLWLSNPPSNLCIPQTLFD